MARRRTRGSSSAPPRRPHAASTILIGLAVLLLGLGLGITLSRGAPWRVSMPVPAPVKSPVPMPHLPTPSAPLVIDDPSLDAAVRRAIALIGTLVRETQDDQTAPQESQQLRWHLHMIEVRPRGDTADALQVVGQEVERAGGKVLSRSPTGIRVGVQRDGRAFVTHEIRVVPVRAQTRVAIIFDDAGGSLDDLEAIIALGRPVTVAVLPGLRFSREVAERARGAGLEVFLHLPVEPEDPTKKVGPGGITTDMSDEEIIQIVRADLQGVPGAVGVNNHMGSRGTADGRVMRAVLQVVRERGLIFVDSVTSPRSIAARMASEMRIPTAARQVFLDNQDDREAIRQQIIRLITLAKRRGEAVAIGHAHRLTARVLSEMLPELDRQGIVLVPASALAR